MEAEKGHFHVAFKDIWELRFHIEQPFFVKGFKEEDVKVLFGMDTGVNPEANSAEVDLIITYQLMQKENSKIVLEYHSRSEFIISDVAEYMDGDILKRDILYPLVDTAMHMTRGMMAVRLQGTDFRKSLPPMLEPARIIDPFLEGGKE